MCGEGKEVKRAGVSLYSSSECFTFINVRWKMASNTKNFFHFSSCCCPVCSSMCVASVLAASRVHIHSSQLTANVLFFFSIRASSLASYFCLFHFFSSSFFSFHFSCESSKRVRDALATFHTTRRTSIKMHSLCFDSFRFGVHGPRFTVHC